MEEKEIKLNKEKETKNTFMYQAEENGQPAAVKNIYVQKWAFEDEAPESMKITVKDAE